MVGIVCDAAGEYNVVDLVLRVCAHLQCASSFDIIKDLFKILFFIQPGDPIENIFSFATVTWQRQSTNVQDNIVTQKYRAQSTE